MEGGNLEHNHEKENFEKKIEILKASLLFGFSSVFMILINKAATTYTSISVSILIFYQNAATLLILKCKHWNSCELNDRVLRHWFPCGLLFTINIYSSLQSLRFINVATFSLFRNTQPLVVFGMVTFVLHVCTHFIKNEDMLQKIDRIKTLNPTLEKNSLAFLVYVVAGTIIYANYDIEFSTEGYAWAFVHVLSMSLYSMMVKYKSVLTMVIRDLETVPSSSNVEESTKSDVFYEREMASEEMSFYNNCISLPILLFFLITEFSIMNIRNSKENASLHRWLWQPLEDCFFPDTESVPMCPAIVLSSFLGSFFVSVGGFKIQRLITPISWLTLNNATKIPAIVLSVLFFHVQLNEFEICGLVVSLSAAYFYSVAQSNSAVFSGLTGIFAHLVYVIIFLMTLVLHVNEFAYE